jgi:hypothetical protein
VLARTVAAMSDRPALDQINLVTRDMDATVALYRGLGLDIPAPFADAEYDARCVWPPSSSPSE